MSAFKDWLNGLTSKATPVDADVTYVRDSEAAGASKKLTWANVKATLTTYFDALYQPLAANLTAWAALATSSKADSGAVGSSGLTMATARLLGRSTAGTGAVEEITLGTNLSFSGTTLNAAGGGGSPGGSTTQVQYNDAGAFAGDAGLTYNSTTDVLTVAGGVEVGTSAMHTFTGRTDQGMASLASYAVGLKVSGSVFFSNSINNGAASWCRALHFGPEYYSADQACVYPATERLEVRSGSGGAFYDLKLRNLIGAVGGAQYLYNLDTDASNYERGFMRWSSDVLEIGCEKAGTGTARSLALTTNNTTRVTIASDGARVGIGTSPGSAGRTLTLEAGLLFGNGWGFLTTTSFNGQTSTELSALRYIVIAPGSGYGLVIQNLPTSSAGLPAGQVWNDGGTLKIA